MTNKINLKILVCPKGQNPYQELLYSKIRKKNIIISYLTPSVSSHSLWLFIFLFPQLLIYRLKGYIIFHLHWLYPFHIPFLPNLLNRILMTIYIFLFFVWIKILGYKLVYTIHNIVSHDKQFIDDICIGRFISKMSDVKIIHSKNNIIEMKKYGYNMSNVYIIPQGNYIGYYKNTITKEKARKILGLSRNNIVFLFFGMIRSYKNIEKLLIDFRTIVKKYKKAKLLVVGECFDEDLKNKLISMGNNTDNIRLVFRHIKDDDVQLYFNSSDVVVLPFKEITNSGSAMLAFSKGRPVIAPDLGAITDYPLDIGLFYSPNSEYQLKNAMIKSIVNKKKLSNMGRQALLYAKSLDWNSIALNTLSIYRNIL